MVTPFPSSNPAASIESYSENRAVQFCFLLFFSLVWGARLPNPCMKCLHTDLFLITALHTVPRHRVGYSALDQED